MTALLKVRDAQHEAAFFGDELIEIAVFVPGPLAQIADRCLEDVIRYRPRR